MSWRKDIIEVEVFVGVFANTSVDTLAYFVASGAARLKGGNFTPLLNHGPHFRFELLSTPLLNCQNSMKINNLHALEGSCWVYNRQF